MEQHDERPAWLAEKFETPEALAESYRHAEQKIREQGMELGTLREQFESLSEQYAELEAATQQGPPESSLETMRMLAEQAQQVQQTQAPPELIAAGFQRVVEQGEQLAARTIPAYGEHSARVLDLFQTDQAWRSQLEQAASSGNAATVAGVIGGAIQALAASRELTRVDARDMKLGAQGLTGGQSGRPDDNPQAEWDRIRDAGLGSYSDLMRG